MGKRARSPVYFLRYGLWLSFFFFYILLRDFISSYNFNPISKMMTNLYCFFAWTFAWLPTACFLLEDSATTSDSIGRLYSIIKHQQNLGNNFNFAVDFVALFGDFSEFHLSVEECRRIGILFSSDILRLPNLVWTSCLLVLACTCTVTPFYVH